MAPARWKRRHAIGRTLACILAASALAGCGTDEAKSAGSPHSYIHPPEAPHLLAQLPAPPDKNGFRLWPTK